MSTELAVVLDEALDPPLAPVDFARDPVTVYLARLAPSSRRTMLGALRRVAGMLKVGASIAATPWHGLTYGEMVMLCTRLRDECGAPATANRILAAVRGVCQEAANLGLMSREVCAAILSVKGVRGSRLPAGRALESPEVQSLSEHCEAHASVVLGLRDRAILALLFGGGLRRAEAAGLTLAQVAPGARSVTVRGKGNKDRSVPLPKDATAALGLWLEARGDEPGPVLVSMNKHGGMRRRGKHGPLRGITDSGVNHALKSLAARSGVDTFSAHDARRTRITNLLAAGKTLTVVQRLAGHARSETTARYDRAPERAVVAAAELVGAF